MTKCRILLLKTGAKVKKREEEPRMMSGRRHAAKVIDLGAARAAMKSRNSQ
jgi:hypothetical protein